MDDTKDLLFELGCAELPAKGLNNLAKNLAQKIEDQFQQAQLTYGEIKTFATPRRIAVLIQGLITKQPDRQIEKRGPGINAPQAAKEGFARSCQIGIDQLQQIETPQGSWLVQCYVEPGKNTIELIPQLIQHALKELYLLKSMRWGIGEYTFIRPIQWLVLLFGEKIVDAEFFGVKTSNQTHGHRFHDPQAITINNPNKYEKILEEQGKVIPHFEKRKQLITEQVVKIEQDSKCKAVIDPELLDEVTGIVEWPVTLLGSFEQRFINLPKEVLICSMQHHQKCFPVVGKDDLLLPHFIMVSNIESKDVSEVINGNKRVIQARLSDAEFFYETDCKKHLSDYADQLKNVVFQHKLGSLYEKSLRIGRLAKFIAEILEVDSELAEKAGLLCKADLMTNMVGEFPDVQGIMGYYYFLRENKEAAKNQIEKNNSVAIALRDHYLPKFSGDKLPESRISCAVALADRFDTIVGLFGINQPPTGEKDPFGLRRAAISILRIIIENKLNINLFEVIEWAVSGYTNLSKNNVIEQVQEFILERLRAYYTEHGILPDTLAAVVAVQNLFPLDIDYRLRAVQSFRQLSEAKELSEANKRAKNILEKSAVSKDIFSDNVTNQINSKLFEKTEEQTIYDAILQKSDKKLDEKISAEKYTERLRSLAELYKPVNAFFDAVMVNVEDEKIRQNRLLLVAAMRQLFLQVADISLLQV